MSPEDPEAACGLDALARAVDFTADTCLWLGTPLARLDPRHAGGDAVGATRALAATVYRDFYRCGGVRAGDTEPLPPDPATAATRADALDELTAGHVSWHAGWRIHQLSGDAAVVSRDGLLVDAPPGSWEPLGPATPGQPARLALPAGRRLLGAGVYLVEGRGALGSAPPALVRLYFNAVGEELPALVALLAARLDHSGVPFQLKAFLDPAETDRRADCVVLYVPAAAWADVAPAAAAVPRASPRLVRAAVPAFTLRLAAGISLAEDPGTGPSFGMVRSRQAAEALMAAHQAGARGTAAVLAHAREGLRQAGVDPDRPWLFPGSTGDYRWPADR